MNAVQAELIAVKAGTDLTSDVKKNVGGRDFVSPEKKLQLFDQFMLKLHHHKCVQDFLNCVAMPSERSKR